MFGQGIFQTEEIAVRKTLRQTKIGLFQEQHRCGAAAARWVGSTVKEARSREDTGSSEQVSGVRSFVSKR